MGTRPKRLVRGLRGSEEGIALPVTLLILTIAMVLATVPVMASMNAQHGDVHNQAGNEALAAAEAGAELAVLKLSEAGGGAPCTPATVTAGSEVAGWCAPAALPAESTPPGTEVRYRVKPGAEEVKIVATGTAQAAGAPVARRVEVTAGAVPGQAPNVFSAGEIVGIESLLLSNNAQVYGGGAASNGSVELIGSANVCGKVRYGTSFLTPDRSSSVQPPPTWWCSEGREAIQISASEMIDYPPVKLPEDIADHNSDTRLEGADKTSQANRTNISWNKSNWTLTVGGGELTLGGSEPYLLCRLEVTSGAKLLMAPGAEIEILFKPPEECPGLNSSPQLTIWNGAYVAGDATKGPVFAFVGSITPGKSRIELQGGAEAQQFVIYAPQSSVHSANNFQLGGAIVGRTLIFEGGSTANKSFKGNPRQPEGLESAAGSFARTGYVECSSEAAAGAAPDGGC